MELLLLLLVLFGFHIQESKDRGRPSGSESMAGLPPNAHA